MGYYLNEHAQPILRSKKNTLRIDERKIDELIGLCKGIIADNSVNQSEADLLCQWLTSNSSVSEQWPANILYKRIYSALQDKVLDNQEMRDILETLRQITGGIPDKDVNTNSMRLPISEPLPEVIFKNQLYCFTGQFATGTREQVESIVINKGGQIQPRPTRKTNYLVIGILGSTDWIHSTYGRKIEYAVQLRERGNIQIISEEYWAKFI